MLRVNRSLVNSQDGGEIYDSIAKVDVANAEAINTIAPTFSNITGSNNVSVDATGDIQLADVFTNGMDASYRIYQSYANTNLVGEGWNGSDIGASFYFSPSSGTTLFPQAISSDEAFGSPSLVLGSVTLGATAIPSEEVFGSPSLLAGASSVQPSAIPTGEALGSPDIGVGGVLIEPVSIVSEELFGTPDIVSGLTAITPVGISSAEAFGAGLVQNLLVIIEPLGIPAEDLFGNPLVLGGDRIVIPVANRATWNKIASYLRTLSFTGSDNDVIIAWLRSEGLAGGQYNDLWVDYFESVGFTGGSLTDNQALWKKGENG